MTGGTDSDVPRLPPRADGAEVRQLELDLISASPPTRQLDQDWPAFVEPELLKIGPARILLLLGRFIAFGWALAVLVTMILVQRTSVSGRDVELVRDIGRFGIVAALVVASSGWYWSDRTTCNVHRLAARKPTRLRCVSAWGFSLGVALLVAGSMMRLEAQDLRELRPLLLLLAALAVWRPLSLVRRVLLSLTRLRFDGLIASAFAFELCGAALICWQLASAPAGFTVENMMSGEPATALWAAAALCLGAGVIIWATLTREVQRAEAHRVLALRTQHDHRNLRLRGIDPMNAEVRWALVRSRQAAEEPDLQPSPAAPAQPVAPVAPLAPIAPAAPLAPVAPAAALTPTAPRSTELTRAAFAGWRPTMPEPAIIPSEANATPNEPKTSFPVRRVEPAERPVPAARVERLPAKAPAALEPASKASPGASPERVGFTLEAVATSPPPRESTAEFAARLRARLRSGGEETPRLTEERLTEERLAEERPTEEPTLVPAPPDTRSRLAQRLEWSESVCQ